MDRKISKQQLRREKIRLWAKILGGVLGVVIILALLIHLYQPSVKSNEVELSKVQRGDIEITLSATGKVVPMSEQSINSPITSTILEVYKHSGDSVRKGEPIMLLDLETVEAELSDMLDKRTMASLELEQLKIRNSNSLSELKLNLEVQQIEQEQRREKLETQRYLDSLGAGTPKSIKEIALEVKLADMKLKESDMQLKNQQELLLSELKIKELEYKILNGQIAQKEQLIRDAQILSPRSSVLSFVNEQIGEVVSQGSKVAMLSDISSFKVAGSIANNYASRVGIGSDVIVRVDNTNLRGKISNLNPVAVENTLALTVQLEDNDNKILHSGVSCNIYVVEARIENSLMIRSGAYYTGSGNYTMYVLDESGEKLELRAVRLGQGNYDKVEVISGLEEGEQVVVSDTKKIDGKREVKYINK